MRTFSNSETLIFIIIIQWSFCQIAKEENWMRHSRERYRILRALIRSRWSYQACLPLKYLQVALPLFWFILCISLDGRIFLSCEAPFLCLVLFQNSAGAALGGCETFKELDQTEKQVIRDGSLKVTQMIWGCALCSWPMPWWEATAAYCLTMERDFRCHHLSSMINCSPSKTMSQNGYPFSLPKQDHQLRPKNILNPDLLKLLLILWKEIEVPTFTIPLGLSS